MRLAAGEQEANSTTNGTAAKAVTGYIGNDKAFLERLKCLREGGGVRPQDFAGDDMFNRKVQILYERADASAVYSRFDRR